MCAYLEGYKFELLNAPESADDITKNGFKPIIYCDEHNKEPNRDYDLQKYYRRFSTNYKHTLDFSTLEAFKEYLKNEELGIVYNPQHDELDSEV